MISNGVIRIILIIICVKYIYGSFLENYLEYSKVYSRHYGRDFGNFKYFDLNKTYEVNEAILRLHFWIFGYIKGLNDFDIHQISVSPDLNIIINATLQKTGVVSQYYMKGFMYNIFPLDGKGPFELSLTNFTFYLNTKVLPRHGHLRIVSFEFLYDFKDLELTIGGLTQYQEISLILQDFIKDSSSLLLRTFKKYLQNEIKIAVLTTINAELQKLTFKDLIEFCKDLFS